MTETAPPATTPSGRNDELIALALVDTLSCLNQVQVILEAIIQRSSDPGLRALLPELDKLDSRVDEMLEDVKRFQHV